MRYLRLQRSQSNRRRIEREAERSGQPPRVPEAEADSGAREYPAPAEPRLDQPRRRKSG